MAEEDDELRRELDANRAGMEQSRRAVDPTYVQREVQREAQQGFLANLSDSFAPSGSAVKRRWNDEWRRNYDTALENIEDVGAYKIAQYLGGEEAQRFKGAIAWGLSTGQTLFRQSEEDPDYDRNAHAAELVKDVPVEYWNDVLDHGNLAAAQREKARILDSISRTNRLANQKGATSTIAMVVGGFIDVDAPLILASSGALAGTKLAQAGYRGARAIGMSQGASTTAGSIVAGAAGGAQAGAVIGAAEQWADPTMDWKDTTLAVLGGATMGAAFGTVFRGEAGQAVQRMRDDLAAHKITMPDRVNDDVDARAMDGYFQLDEPSAETPGVGSASTAGATQVQQSPNYASSLNDPFKDEIHSSDQAIIQKAHNYMTSSGAAQDLADIENTAWGKMVTGRYGSHRLAESVGGLVNHAAQSGDVMRFYKSKSAVMNTLGITIFENPSSFGRGIVSSSAATLEEVFERRGGSTLREYGSYANRWAKENGKSMKVMGMDTGVASPSAKMEFNRQVRLNLFDIDQGRAPRDASNAEIMRAVNAHGNHMEEMLRTLKSDNPLQTGVKGSENIQPNRGYVPQRGNGNAINGMIRDGRITRQSLTKDIEASYLSMGMSQEGAEVSAKAWVARMIAGDIDVDTHMVDLLTQDGREFLQQRLSGMGMSKPDAEQIVEALAGQAEYRGREGYTKHRNTLNIETKLTTTDGSSMQVLDVLNNDIETLAQQYRRRAAGQAALARKGIRSRMDLDRMISAARTEMQALGEEAPPTDWFDAMFSDFYGGVRWGYFQGRVNKGQEAGWTIAKDIAGLSLLGQLGFSQLIDGANLIAAAGLKNFVREMGGMSRLNKELRDTQSSLRQDLAPFYGDIGMDHQIFRPHINLDDINPHEGQEFIKATRKFLNNAQMIQAYTNGFNFVRRKEQELAASLLSNKVLRAVKDGQYTDRMKTDLGIDDQLFDALTDMVNNGTIEFKTINGVEYVNRLNPDKWANQDLIDAFASVMVRGQNNMVQRNMIGEQALWTRTNVGGMLSYLKMFPLTAMSKQFQRNLRYMDVETMGTALWGIGVAFIAMNVRDALNGRSTDLDDQARRAIAYSNMLGWVPMATDPALTMLGLDEYRMQRYGRHYEVSVAPVEVANRLLKTPGAAIKAATGEDLSGSDKQALLAIPFMRTLGIGSWLVN